MSGGLLFLSANDLTVQKGARGNILCNSIPGFSLILFYSTQCQYCQNLIPIFKSLPGTVGGCQFGMINVSKNKSVILLSKETIAPITYVPYMILYIQGKPFMRYDGPPNQKEIQNFILDVASKIQSKQQFTKTENPNVQEDTNSGIPAYCLGKPLYGDKEVCYLEFDNAYDK